MSIIRNNRITNLKGLLNHIEMSLKCFYISSTKWEINEKFFNRKTCFIIDHNRCIIIRFRKSAKFFIETNQIRISYVEIMISFSKITKINMTECDRYRWYDNYIWTRFIYNPNALICFTNILTYVSKKFFCVKRTIKC